MILDFFPAFGGSSLVYFSSFSRAECFDGQPVVARVRLLGRQPGILGDTAPAAPCGLVPRAGLALGLAGPWGHRPLGGSAVGEGAMVKPIAEIP